MTSAATIEAPISVREEAKSMTQEEFKDASTRAELEFKASQIGLDDEAIAGAKTKAELVELIYGQFTLPDPALRGESTIDSPVAAMWALCNKDLVENGPEGKMRRKDAVEAGQKLGVAFYTARTQYQAWFDATDKGTKPLNEKSDPTGLPVQFARELGLLEEEAEEK